MNTKTQLGLRVLLDSAAENQLQEMEAILSTENNFLKINPSRLTSWIVSHFYKYHFHQQKESIAKAHFNSKEYLRQLASEITGDDDAISKLSDALKGLQNSKKLRTDRNKVSKLIEK